VEAEIEGTVPAQIAVSILMMDGDVVEIVVDAGATIRDLKTKLAERSGIGSAMSLVLYPETWESEDAPSNGTGLEEAGVSNGSTLMAVVLSGIPHHGKFGHLANTHRIYGIQPWDETKSVAWDCCYNTDADSTCCCTCGGRWHLVKEIGTGRTEVSDWNLTCKPDPFTCDHFERLKTRKPGCPYCIRAAEGKNEARRLFSAYCVLPKSELAEEVRNKMRQGMLAVPTSTVRTSPKPATEEEEAVGVVGVVDLFAETGDY
jgi:hypothetical protein